jgi:hypothetical protein
MNSGGKCDTAGLANTNESAHSAGGQQASAMSRGLIEAFALMGVPVVGESRIPRAAAFRELRREVKPDAA